MKAPSGIYIGNIFAQLSSKLPMNATVTTCLSKSNVTLIMSILFVLQSPRWSRQIITVAVVGDFADGFANFFANLNEP